MKEKCMKEKKNVIAAILATLILRSRLYSDRGMNSQNIDKMKSISKGLQMKKKKWDALGENRNILNGNWVLYVSVK